MVTIDEFKKLEIISARIESVQEHPNADKLLVLEVDTGGSRKSIVAGIKNFYSKDGLVGKDIIMINNLEPAVIRGVESNGMLLAVQDENGISLIRPDRPVSPGHSVK